MLPVSSSEIFKIVNAWVKAGKPAPQKWSWGLKSLSTPVDFLMMRFEPAYIPLIEALLKAGEKYNQGNFSKHIVLNVLFTHPKLTITDQKTLLDLFKVNLQRSYLSKSGEEEKNGNNLLHEIVQNCTSIRKDLLQCLLQFVDIDQKNTTGETALHTALRKEDFVLAQLLIEVGANLQIADQKKTDSAKYN